MRKIVKVVFCLVISLAAGVAGAAKQFNSASYVQDGLINQWDAIDNEGTGTHNNEATVWKDLKGSLDMTLTSGGSWGTHYLNVSGCAAKAASATTAYRTIEVVYRMTNNVGAVLFASGWAPSTTKLSRWVEFSSKGTRCHFDHSNAKRVYKSGLTFDAMRDWSLLARYSDDDTISSVGETGVVQQNPSSENKYSTAVGDGVAMIGARQESDNAGAWYGRVYAIRLYNRQLTDEELAKNFQIDRARFFEDDGRVVVVGDPEDYPADISPTYGLSSGYVVGENYTFTAPASWTSAAGDVKVTCAGYEVCRRSTTTGEWVRDDALSGVGNSFTLAYPGAVRVDWVWATKVDLDISSSDVSRGTVNVQSGAYDYGTEVTLVATAVPGAGEFYRWDGDLPEYRPESDKYQPTLVVPMNRARKIRAIFSVDYPEGTRYATVSGNDGHDGLSWQTAKRSVQAAADDALVDGLVMVGEGTFYVPDGKTHVLDLAKVVTVKSLYGPEMTALDASRNENGTVYSNGGATDRSLTMSAAATVAGFTLKGGATKQTNGPLHASLYVTGGGTVSNCLIKSRYIWKGRCATVSGTASAPARIVDCVFDGAGCSRGNTDTANAGGLYLGAYATAERCIVRNWSMNGYSASYRSAAVTLGAATAALVDSLVVSNVNGSTTAEYRTAGGVELMSGLVENCTIAANTSAGFGAGLYVHGAKDCTVRNTIIYGNTANLGSNDVACASNASVFENCCASDLDKVAGGLPSGSTIADPQLDPVTYRLTEKSASPRDRGVNTERVMADGAIDLAGGPRIIADIVDMGCYEGAELPADMLSVSISVAPDVGRRPFTPVFAALPLGNLSGLTYLWDFGDGETSTLAQPTHTYATGGVYRVRVTVTNGAGGTASDETAVTAVPDVVYVATDGKAVAPFVSWGNAATDIRDALALKPKKIVVGDGTHNVKDNNQVVDTDTEIVSLNGPTKSTLNGSSCRILKLQHPQAKLLGFKFTGGYISNNSGWSDGAITVQGTAGLIANCIFASNGAGCYKTPYAQMSGTVVVSNCTFRTGPLSGNLNATHSHSIYLHDSAVMTHCVVTNCSINEDKTYTGCNSFVELAGSSTMRNCLFVNNRFNSHFGNAVNGLVTVEENATVENCTFANNEVPPVKGGAIAFNTSGASAAACNLVFANNVVFGTDTVGDVYDAQNLIAPWSRVTFSCSSQLTQGDGNSDRDPWLRPTYRAKALTPRPGSPCLNSAQPREWMSGGTDLNGNPRVYGGKPDMGCFESQSGGILLLVK